MSENLQRFYKSLNDLGAHEFRYCTRKEESEYLGMKASDLPDDVVSIVDRNSDRRFLRCTDMAEVNAEIGLLNAKNIKAIKNCLTVLVALMAISLIGTIVTLFVL